MRVTAILGISAFYHDSAAALIVDGDIAAAAQEERFTRKKHDPGFPSHAIAYCLKEGGVKPEGLDYIAFYDKPLTKFDRLRDIPGLRAGGVQKLPAGHAALAQRQAPHAADASAALPRRPPRAARLHRPPRKPRR